jgi:hypothetical protein
MAEPSKSPQSLTLNQVSQVLGVPTRKIQYLREAGVVMPEVIGRGRGRFCLYSETDVEMVYLAAVELENMTAEAKRYVVQTVLSTDRLMIDITFGDAVSVHVDRRKLKSIVSSLLSILVDL